MKLHIQLLSLIYLMSFLNVYSDSRLGKNKDYLELIDNQVVDVPMVFKDDDDDDDDDGGVPGRLDDICDKIEDLSGDVTLLDEAIDNIATQLSGVEASLCEKIEDLKPGCCDIVLTQADFPYVTITAGQVICLDESVTLAQDETGITVAHDNIVINLCGHTIDGGSNSGTIGISASNVNKLKIKNGNICNVLSSAIAMDTVNGIFVNDIHMSVVSSGSGIGLNNCSNGKIRCCTCRGSESSFSFGFFAKCNNFMLFDCLSSNANIGYFLSDTSNICLLNCKSLLASIGFNFNIQSSRIVFKSCIAQECGTGFSDIGSPIGRTRNIVLEGCVANASTTFGISILSGITRDLSIRNCVTNNNDRGIVIAEDVTGEVVGCTAIGNTTTGIFNASSTCGVYNCHARDNGTDFDDDGTGLISTVTPGPSVTDTTAYWSNVGT